MDRTGLFGNSRLSPVSCLIKAFQRHIEGMACLPPAINEYPNGHTLPEDEADELEKIEEKRDIYKQREAMIKAQILTTIPETLAIKVQSLETGKEIWDTLCKKHEKRALTVVVDLQHRIYSGSKNRFNVS